MPELASVAKALRRELASKLKAEIERRGLSQAAAARFLGVSRQRLHHYVHGTATPRSDFLTKLLGEWDLVLEVGGKAFGVGAFGEGKSAEVRAEQLPLFEKVRRLPNGAVVISFSRAGRERTELELQIKAPPGREVGVVLRRAVGRRRRRG